MDKPLIANKRLTRLIKEKGVSTLYELLDYIRLLPYGRTKNRKDLSLVIREEKGTCSSKHACVKAIAEENNMDEIKLILCIYKMSEKNTPGIGNALSKNGLSFIPEAHCFLIVNQERIDLTNENSDLSNIQNDIIEEIEIVPSQVGEYKVDYHKKYIREWMDKKQGGFSFDELWHIREQCISNL